MLDVERNKLTALEDIVQAAKTLYASFTPEQQAAADPRLANIVAFPILASGSARNKASVRSNPPEHIGGPRRLTSGIVLKGDGGYACLARGPEKWRVCMASVVSLTRRMTAAVFTTSSKFGQ